jgi:sulfite dehydrogenase (cytochrome) subunit B
MRTFVFALVVAAAVAPAAADETPVALKQASGVEKVEANCAACHSLDYIPMNSPFLAPTAWDAEVGKMVKIFGARISDADAATIEDYLKKNYGERHEGGL